MDTCSTCEVGKKLEYCCGSHPETRASVEFGLSDGRTVRACPHLGQEGKCDAYATRPDDCREYTCPGFDDRRS